MDALDLIAQRPRRLARRAGSSPARDVLVIGVDRCRPDGLMAHARLELARSHHRVRFGIATGTGGLGKFENLNALLDQHLSDDDDWLVVIDDDVALPPRFLDGMLLVAERLDFRLAQPAHRRWSFAAWSVTRRRPATVARESAFVEIGPVTFLHASTFAELLPFPDLKMGWGLDAHWAAVAQQRGWKMGIVDAFPVAHRSRPVGASYSGDMAVAEADAFLSTHAHLTRVEMDRTVRGHRSLT
jgi:hypothetical protein